MENFDYRGKKSILIRCTLSEYRFLHRQNVWLTQENERLKQAYGAAQAQILTLQKQLDREE